MKVVLICRLDFTLPGVLKVVPERTGVENEAFVGRRDGPGLAGEGSGGAVIGVEDKGCGILPTFAIYAGSLEAPG